MTNWLPPSPHGAAADAGTERHNRECFRTGVLVGATFDQGRLAQDDVFRLGRARVAALALAHLRLGGSIEGIRPARDERELCVRARGRFVGRRTPPGVPELVSSTGYLLIRDSSGEILGMGAP